MSDEISVKDVERRVFAAAFQDGLVDIGIGGFLLAFVFAPYLSPALGDFWATLAVFMPLWVLVYPGLWLIRRVVVKPRLGTVSFGAWRITRLKRFNLLAFLLLVLSLALSVLSTVEFEAVPGWVHTARFSLIFLLLFCLAAYFLDFPRLAVYGVLTALAAIVGEVLYQYLDVPHHGFPVTFGISAGVMIVIGAVSFIRFLRQHPPPNDIDETSGRGE